MDPIVVLGMVKNAATRSGNKYVVDREELNSMVVNKLYYMEVEL